MKKLVTLTFVLVTAIIANAQPPEYYNINHDLIVNALLRSQDMNVKVERKTTAQERLIGMSSYDGATIASANHLYDSAAFFYSNGRGSRYDFSKMTYNLSLPTNSYYPPMYLNTISPNNLGDILYDSLHKIQSIVGTGYNHSAVYCKYNGNLTVEQDEVNMDADTAINEQIFIYSLTGNVEKITNIFKSTHVNDTPYITYFLYNPGNQLIIDSTVEVNAGKKNPWGNYTFQYDIKGNLTRLNAYVIIGGNSRLVQQFTFTYTGDNKLATVLMDTGKSLGHYKLDSFAYITGSSYFTFTTDSLWNGTQWILNARQQKYLNANGVPDSMISESMDTGWMDYVKDIYTYTSKNNPLFDYSIVTSLGGGDAMVKKYYYETYTDVPAVNKPENNVQLFPNPVTDELNIKLSNTPARVTLNIFSDDGRLVRRITFSNSNNIKLNISDLTRGAYIYQLNNANGWSSSGKFVKQ